MKRIILVFALFLLGFTSVFAQNEQLETDYYNALDSVDVRHWGAARLLFSNVLREEPDNANVQYFIGYCWLKLNKPTKAISVLQQAVNNVGDKLIMNEYEDKKASLMAYIVLAEAYHKNYQFSESLETLANFRNKYTEKITPVLDRRMKMLAQWDSTATLLMKYPMDIDAENLGEGINSIYDDHSPVVSADEHMLIFTSRRKNSANDEMLFDGQYDENLYIVYKDPNDKWESAKKMNDSINTDDHDASIGLSADGQTLLIYRNVNRNADIYYSKRTEDRKWTNPVRFPAPINSKYRETGASLSVDGKTIYFSSNRKGGYGGMDIYKSQLRPDGSWSKPENLGPHINTPRNEIAPFIHYDGVTLFFSSNGQGTMGGYDVFFSMYDEDEKDWEEATNIGYPINSVGDDVFYQPTPDGHRAYCASNRFGSYGGSDIYMIRLQKEKEDNITILSGVVQTVDGQPANGVELKVYGDRDQLLGLYHPNKKTGRYIVALPTGKYSAVYYLAGRMVYDQQLEAKEQESYNKIQKTVQLQPVVLDYVKYLSFEPEFFTIEGETQKVLDKLVTNEEVRENGVNVFTLEKPVSLLSRKRILAVADYLMDKEFPEDKIYTKKKGTEAVSLIILPDEQEPEIVAENNEPETETEPENNSNESKPEIAEVAKKETTSSKKPVVEETPVEEEQVAVGDVVLHPIYFGFNKQTAEEQAAELNQLAAYLKQNKTAKIQVNGYTDLQGDAEYNKVLSILRARFVKDKVVAMGASAKQILVVGHGEENQISSDLNPNTRKYNRRVVFKVLHQGTTGKIIAKMPEIPDNCKIKDETAK